MEGLLLSVHDVHFLFHICLAELNYNSIGDDHFEKTSKHQVILYVLGLSGKPSALIATKSQENGYFFYLPAKCDVLAVLEFHCFFCIAIEKF